MAIPRAGVLVQRGQKSAPELEGCWGMVEEPADTCNHVKLIFLELGKKCNFPFCKDFDKWVCMCSFISCKLPEESRLCHVRRTEGYRNCSSGSWQGGLWAPPRILMSLAGRALAGSILVDSRVFSCFLCYVLWVGGGIENRSNRFLRVLYNALLSPTLKLNRMFMKRF